VSATSDTAAQLPVAAKLHVPCSVGNKDGNEPQHSVLELLPLDAEGDDEPEAVDDALLEEEVVEEPLGELDDEFEDELDEELQSSTGVMRIFIPEALQLPASRDEVSEIVSTQSVVTLVTPKLWDAIVTNPRPRLLWSCTSSTSVCTGQGEFVDRGTVIVHGPASGFQRSG
jgi:hypothetical protein